MDRPAREGAAVRDLHNCNPSVGLLASPCPECGHKTLHQSIALEADAPHITLRAGPGRGFQASGR